MLMSEGNLVFSLQAIWSQTRFASNGLILTLEVNMLISSPAYAQRALFSELDQRLMGIM